MSKSRALSVGILGLAVLVAAWLWWDLGRNRESYLVYDDKGATCAIIVPASPTEPELAAAKLLSETLAAAAGRESNDFPIQRESRWRFWQKGIKVGNTSKAGLLLLAGTTRLERPVGAVVSPGGVILRSRWPEDIVAAASWFLEKHTGAHWFMPGPLGQSVPRRSTLRLPLGVETAAPSFISRNLGGIGGPEGAAWFAANRLQAVLGHNHSMSEIFKPEDVVKMPALAPLVNWQKYVPTQPHEQGWQPNLAAAEAAPHAISVLRRQLTHAPTQVAASLSMNDTINYDQSKETQALVGPPRYFRQKPDFSNLVFGFANQVARGLAAEFPDRFVTTYAYDWTEDVPRFPVEPNVVPYLTADRSQWFDPVFAAEDRDLMKRWVAAGPKLVGIYDYFYGASYLVPHPTLYAVAQSIPFAHEAGVRAFYAECYPNWGNEGPKLWLAAQLLWDATRDPAGLIDTYYREYWQEAAGPMREFFELCDKQWLEQPLPSYWLKYFKDEHQALRFPPEVRLALRVKLEAADRLAQSDTVRQRLALTEAAFAVSDAFCEFTEARERVSRLALADPLDRTVVVAAAATMQRVKGKLNDSLSRTKAAHPLAVTTKLLEEYTRNDPRRRALWRLQQPAPAVAESGQFTAAFGDLLPAPLGTGRQELTVDGELLRLTLRDVADFTTLDYVQTGYWRGHGEPYETRRITLQPGIGHNTIRFAGCKQETLSQWYSAEGGSLYTGTVQVRAKVSPGNMTFLIVSFLDAKGKHIGIGFIDRLPVGDWSGPVELAVLVRAPKEAAQIGLGVRVLNQVNDDYAEFAQLSLKRVEAKQKPET